MLKERFRNILNANNILNNVGIEITNACNMRCIHCYQSNRIGNQKSIVHLPFEAIKKVVDQLVDLKTMRISLTGGEVLCHPDFLKIIDYINDNNISISLLSNITMFTTELISKIKGKVHGIYTTKYGFDENTYETITRTPGSYKKYLQAASIIKEADIYLEERTILLKQNSHQIDSMFDECDTIEVKIDVDPNDEYAKKCQSSDSCKRAYFKRIQEFVEPKHFNISDLLEKKVCNVCEDSICITCEGNVVPCINLNVVMGSIFTDSIESIWNSKRIDDIKENAKIKYFKKCINCPDVMYNRYWCMATNSYETGDIHTPSCYSCEMCRGIKKSLKEEKQYDKN